MPSLVTLVDGTVPVAADFNGNYTVLNNAIGSSTSIAAWSTGELPYASAANTLSRLVPGAEGTVLSMTTTIPGWSIRPLGQGRLTRVSGTSLKFGQFNGTRIPVKTSGAWALRDITSAGVLSGNPTTASNFVDGASSQTLAANTVYLVTVFDNSGTLTLDFRTTLTHVPDTTTGVEIASGVDTRTVVGLIRTNATPNFVDSATQRFTRSWFNPVNAPLLNTFSADRTANTGTYAEMNTEIRIEFVIFSGETATISVNGSVSNSNAGYSQTGVGFDGTSVEAGFEANTDHDVAAARNIGGLAGHKSGLSEGYHYATLLGRISAGTGTWVSSSSTSQSKVYLHGRVTP